MSDTPTEPTPDFEPPADNGATVTHTFGGSDSPAETPDEPVPGEGEEAPEPGHEHDDQDANPEHGANSDEEKDAGLVDGDEG